MTSTIAFPRSDAADACDDQVGEVAWMLARQPVETFMALHVDDIAPGWRKSAGRTLVKLLAVANGSPERREAVAGLRVCSTDTELCFFTPRSVERLDDVVQGICRKARQHSCFICRDCGRPARVRFIGEHECVTQCTRCVAPALLKHEIWELDQSLHFLKAVGQPISAKQIPLLLRPSFIESSVREPATTATKVRQGQMELADFVQWADRWRQIGKGLAMVH